MEFWEPGHWGLLDHWFDVFGGSFGVRSWGLFEQRFRDDPWIFPHDKRSSQLDDDRRG
ncbi:MAG: hypothetical protein GY926_20960 [bacterium]|nr:hypothetical protein [bacterium]